MARLLADARSFTLVLDIDGVRHSLGAWESDPIAAGRTARRLAIAAARAHLEDHHDVVVPQFLGRDEFINELEACTSATESQFIEVLLTLDRNVARDAFLERRRTSTDPIHVDAAALVPAGQEDEVLAEMAERLEQLYRDRPQAMRVPVMRGDETATLAKLIDSIGSAGINW